MIGFYAGSFDPFTNGHLEIVRKTSKYFDKVIIGIGHNSSKETRIDREKMKNAIEETLKIENISNASVVTYDGLTINVAQDLGADILIRGLRNGTDYQYEETIAQMNEEYSGLDTCYFRAGNLGYLSSSVVMEIYNGGGKVDRFLPNPVAKVLEDLKNKVKG